MAGNVQNKYLKNFQKSFFAVSGFPMPRNTQKRNKNFFEKKRKKKKSQLVTFFEALVAKARGFFFSFFSPPLGAGAGFSAFGPLDKNGCSFMGRCAPSF